MHFSGIWPTDKGYRLYHPDHGKVFHNHDVKFNESEKEKGNKMNSDPFYHIELDFSHNSEDMTDSENCSTEQSSIEYKAESVPRRSERVWHPPKFYGTRVNVTSQNLRSTNLLKKQLVVLKKHSGRKPWKLKCSH